MEALPPVKSEEPPRVTASSLAAGNVMTRKKNFTIILVGETGTGKTSFLSLLVNVLAGKSPSKYNLEPYDVTNEYGGGQNHSQTKTAKVYEFTSLNNVCVTVLDTLAWPTHGVFRRTKNTKRASPPLFGKIFRS